jgi:hypothetical protein
MIIAYSERAGDGEEDDFLALPLIGVELCGCTTWVSKVRRT